MRISRLLTKTLREVPADTDTISHQYLVRAGYINQLAAGIYTYLPLGWRVLKKIEDIIREEMNKAGGQELSMPVMQPLEIWHQSERDEIMKDVLFRFKDRRDHTLVLGPTHEEVITGLIARYVQSYRDLPLMMYQIQDKMRDEPRPRGGIIRTRELIMKDAYSFDVDENALDTSYKSMQQAYKNTYQRCGLVSIMVEADSGAIGGKDSNEFIVVADSGEDTIISCPKCGYGANQERAVSVKEKFDCGQLLSIEPVSTPGKKSIEEVAAFLKVTPSQTLKAVFYLADGQFIFGVIRGDLEVNEIKLKNHLHCTDLRLATEAEVKEAGVVPGSASPVGLKNVKVIADESVTMGGNFVAGGNKPDVHIRNVNYPRDFKADIVADIATARAGEKCLKCGGTLTGTRGIEVGHIFKLGTRYSEPFNATYLDEKGEKHLIVMGCYGLGVSRLMAAAVEQNHDEKGIIWPAAIAPYQVYLCPLYREGTKVAEVSEKLYKDLNEAGIEVLFDDRDAAPGVKFNDADLIGIPYRITVSPRTLEKNGVEFKKRTEKASEIVPLADIIKKIKGLI